MSKIKVFFGTNNDGKFGDAAKIANDFPKITVSRPSDHSITADPDETEDTYQGNARLKCVFFRDILRKAGQKGLYVIGDDSGIEIDALNGEPGIHSRRWKDKRSRMTDQEIIDYTIEQLSGVPLPKRTAHFVGVLTLGHTDNDAMYDIPYRLSGLLLEQPDKRFKVGDGYPFRALFYLPEHKALFHDIASLPTHKQPKGFASHRENALQTAFQKIIDLE